MQADWESSRSSRKICSPLFINQPLILGRRTEITWESRNYKHGKVGTVLSLQVTQHAGWRGGGSQKAGASRCPRPRLQAIGAGGGTERVPPGLDGFSNKIVNLFMISCSWERRMTAFRCQLPCRRKYSSQPG
uniref:Uncharacterized protein n=1 Tax=Pipistrellus kuhlii TaxID=59472 RepID=A0A7J7VBS5_PIPKU|nr:hypothetical protein mPipKuh1_008499 [Pipistrellus kuhlii]